MKNFREIELLSSYLDGQLNASESARLESRLTSDPELASVLFDIRSARGILRSLPARKAPRNFMLTRKMVGLKPPLPRAYPIFRFSTAFATILLMISFAANLLAPQFSFAASAPQAAYGFGSGVANHAVANLDHCCRNRSPPQKPLLEMARRISTEEAIARVENHLRMQCKHPKRRTESALPEQARSGMKRLFPSTGRSAC